MSSYPCIISLCNLCYIYMHIPIYLFKKKTGQIWTQSSAQCGHTVFRLPPIQWAVTSPKSMCWEHTEDKARLHKNWLVNSLKSKRHESLPRYSKVKIYHFTGRGRSIDSRRTVGGLLLPCFSFTHWNSERDEQVFIASKATPTQIAAGKSSCLFHQMERGWQTDYPVLLELEKRTDSPDES